MLKILHTADVHLGSKFPGLGNKGNEQRRQIEETFKKIMSLAISEKVDILLIAGDLFDSNQQSQKTIDLVISQFNLLSKNNIPVCLIPGNHDCFDTTSIYRKINFTSLCPNLTIFVGQELSCREFPNIGLTVYGRPNLSDRELTSPLQGLKKLTSSRYHVALAHGSFSLPGIVSADDHVFAAAEIANSGMDYIALGHWHDLGKYSSGAVTAYYSGAPEWLDFGQKYFGKVILANIIDNGTVEVQEKTIGLRRSDTIEIDMSAISSWQELENRIASGADINLVRTATLKGLRNSMLSFSPDSMDELRDSLSPAFFALRIKDDSMTPLSGISKDVYSGRPIIARFIELAQNRIDAATDDGDRRVAEDALQYGVALLEDRI